MTADSSAEEWKRDRSGRSVTDRHGDGAEGQTTDPAHPTSLTPSHPSFIIFPKRKSVRLSPLWSKSVLFNVS